MNTKQSISEQFSKEHLSAVLEAMIRVKGGEIDATIFGICFNTSQIVGDDGCVAYDVIEYLSPKWPKYSGDIAYPVPSPNGKETPMYAYNYSDNLWTGEYGQLRYELLDFLIEELTKAVEEYDND